MWQLFCCEALEIFCGTWLDFQHVQTFFLLFKNNLLCLLYIYILGHLSGALVQSDLQ